MDWTLRRERKTQMHGLIILLLLTVDDRVV